MHLFSCCLTGKLNKLTGKLYISRKEDDRPWMILLLARRKQRNLSLPNIQQCKRFIFFLNVMRYAIGTSGHDHDNDHRQSKHSCLCKANPKMIERCIVFIFYKRLCKNVKSILEIIFVKKKDVETSQHIPQSNNLFIFKNNFFHHLLHF